MPLLLLFLLLLRGREGEGSVDDDDDKEVLNIIIVSSLNCNESDPQKSPLKTNTRILTIKMSGVTALRRLAQRSLRTTNATSFKQPRATAEETFCVRSKRSTESELPVARSHEPGELEGGTSGVCDFRRVGRGYRGR